MLQKSTVCPNLIKVSVELVWFLLLCVEVSIQRELSSETTATFQPLHHWRDAT